MASKRITQDFTQINETLSTATNHLVWALQLKIKWDSLNYSRVGVSNLHEELKNVGAISDRLVEIVGTLEFSKLRIISWLNEQQALLDEDVAREIESKLSSWVGKGAAYTEREILAKLKFAEDINALKIWRNRLEELESIIAILKMKQRTYIDFRMDARLLERLLSFGHNLQEI